MAMSDCVRCWDTPCTCGYSYKDYSMEQLIEMRDMFQNLIDMKNMETLDITVRSGPAAGRIYRHSKLTSNPRPRYPKPKPKKE